MEVSSVTHFLLIAFWITYQPVSGQTEPTIALLLDGVEDATFQNAQTLLSSSDNRAVTIHNITNMTPFQLTNKACSLASSGTVVMVTQASCHAMLTLSSAADTLGVTLIAEGNSCQLGNDEEVSMEAIMGDDVIPVKTREPPHLDLALTDTLHALRWQDVLVVYEQEDTYAYGEYLTNLDAILDDMEAVVEMLEVGVSTTVDDVTKVLNYMMQNGKHKHVLVACGVDCMTTLLSMAVDFDKASNQQQRFTYSVNWLLLADAADLDTILGSVHTLNHVTVITPPSKEAVNEVVVDNLLQIVNHSKAFLSETEDWQWETQMTTCGRKLGYFANNLTAEIQVNITNAFEPDITPFVLYAAMWKPGRVRSFEAVAEWTEDSIELFDEIFPNIKFGLNEKHLRIGTNIWDPFVTYDVNSTSGYAGYCMDLLRMLSEQLNFTYELIEPEDGQWGAFANGENTGLVKQLATKEVDIVVAPLAQNLNRSYYVDFSEPFFIELQSVIVKYPDPAEKNWRIYLDPFQWDVWTCVVVSIPVAGIILWAFQRLSAEYDLEEKKKGMGCIDQSLWYTFGSFLTQGSDILPRAQSGRFVTGFWLVYCLVVIASYSGNLVAFFTVSNPTVPFNSLDEMVHSTHKFGTLAGTFTSTYLLEAKAGIYKKIADRMRFFNQTDPSVFSYSHMQHIAKVDTEDYAYIADLTAIQMETTGNCNVDKIKEEFIAMKYAIALQNNSAYIESVNMALESFSESGLAKRWRQDWFPHLSFCDRGLVTSSKPVSISDMQGAFFLMAIILASAMVSLFIELGVWRGRLATKPDIDGVENQHKGQEVRFHQYEQEYGSYEYTKSASQ